MVTCPVCELQQPPTFECSECGAQLAAPMDIDLPPEAVPGLEMTQLDDPHSQVATEADPFVERTELVAPGLAVMSEVLQDFERTSEDFGPRVAAPQAIPDVCPFCATVQPGALVCDGCGRRKIKLAVPMGIGAPVFKERGEDGDTMTRCPRCGSKVKRALACSDCGSPLKHLQELF